jgi:Domain of unknown function DUF29
MPDDLYQRDILTWSEHQADLLRRVARGERVNNLDWAHVVDEIEAVGLSELSVVNSHLRLMLLHLLKLASWPDNSAVRQWREEVAGFQAEAVQRFAPSMRQRIDLDRLHPLALKQLQAADYGPRPPAWPVTCPFTLDQLLNDDVAGMERHMTAAIPSP